jgi:hypothetical protein
MTLREVMFSLLGQSKSVIAKVRATLEGQGNSRVQDMALLGQEGWFLGDP